MSEPEVFHVPDWHVGQCQSGTWRKVGSGELQIATAQATGWRFPGATATC
ncbi:shufflon protein B, partial [Salmonella enterica subsp. enterica serovar Corvallis]